jgi:SAM-dependent methyltransferase
MASVLSRVLYPARQTARGGKPSIAEIDAWVETADTEAAQEFDEVFVSRALELGVSSGMVLDLDSRLGLVTMKILWRREDLLAIGVYRSLEVAERARETAAAWGLGERMFFQVGEAVDLRFKTGYFDLVLSDGALERASDPRMLLEEIGRVAKPSGAILLSQMARPSRLRMRGTIVQELAACPEALRARREASVRSGFTRSELRSLASTTRLDRVRVVGEGRRLFLERSGTDDPSSWVSEREKYV